MLAACLVVSCGAGPSTGAAATATTVGPSAATPTVAPTTPDPTASTTLDTGDLERPDIRTVIVDGTELTVAWADDPDTRARGLMQVDDLGELDGMLFDLRAERVPTFTMRNTLIPIDIAFFSADGQGLGFLEMVPCESDPCPTYGIDAAARYALEVPADSFPMGPDSSLRIP